MNLLLLTILSILVYFFIRIVFQSDNEISELMDKNIQRTSETSKGSSFSLGPKQMVLEANKYDWNLTTGKWLVITLASAVLISLFMYFSFGKEELLLPSGVLGIFVPKILLNRKKRLHRAILLDRLVLFLKAFTNTLLVTRVPVKALREIKGLQDPTMIDEIEKIIVSLDSGLSTKKAFSDLVEKYPFKLLGFYVDQLDMAVADGGKTTFNILSDIVSDIESEKKLVAKLKTDLAREKRAFYQNAVFVLSMPFLFNFMPNMAQALTGSLPGKLVIGFNFIAVLLIYLIVRKLARFNPMAEK